MTISVQAFKSEHAEAYWNNDGSILIKYGEYSDGGGYLSLTAKFLRDMLELQQTGVIFDNILRVPGLFGARDIHTVVTVADEMNITQIQHGYYTAGPKKGEDRIDAVTMPRSDWIKVLGGQADARNSYMSSCGIRPLIGAIDPDVTTDATGLSEGQTPQGE